jgi:recombinational DNA repair ATPase RecF
MKRPVVLPTLHGFSLKDFRPLFRSAAWLDLHEGMNLVQGGNGLGKTTLMQAIVYGMAGGTEDIEQDRSQRWDHRYFLEHTLHRNAATGVKSVTKIPAKSSCTIYLETEEWVSG